MGPKEKTEDAIANQLEIDEERREQALADMLDEDDASDEWGLGNSWDWAGGD